VLASHIYIYMYDVYTASYSRREPTWKIKKKNNVTTITNNSRTLTLPLKQSIKIKHEQLRTKTTKGRKISTNWSPYLT
jgi:hypothetical protein